MSLHAVDDGDSHAHLRKTQRRRSAPRRGSARHESEHDVPERRAGHRRAAVRRLCVAGCISRREARGEISARRRLAAERRRESAQRLVLQDFDQGRGLGQARRPPRGAEGQRLPRRRADDGRRCLPRRLGARHRRNDRGAHPRRRRRDRRQGGVRILLRLRRQPYELDRSGAEPAKARLHHRRFVIGQRRAGCGRRGADGDRRRSGRLDSASRRPIAASSA